MSDFCQFSIKAYCQYSLEVLVFLWENMQNNFIIIAKYPPGAGCLKLTMLIVNVSNNDIHVEK